MKSITQTEGIKHDNRKFTVNVAFDGGVNYEVWAQDKDSAEELALEEFDNDYLGEELYEKTCDVEAEAFVEKRR